MLGAMLGAADNVITTPESQFLVACMPGTDGPLMGDELAAKVVQLTAHWRVKLWAVRDLRQRLVASGQEGGRTYVELISRIVQLYAEDHGKPGVIRWVDHTPGHVRHIDSIRRIFPRARFIHLVRDGRAVAASIIPLRWGPNTVVAAADWWLRMAGVGAAAELAFPPDVIMRVRYEDCIEEPERELRRICSFAGLEYTPAMLEGGTFKPPQYAARQHYLVGNRPDRSRKDSWRQRLTPREIEIFEQKTGDALRYYGYEPINSPPIRPLGRGERFRLEVREWLRGSINGLSTRYRTLAVRLGLLQ